MDTELEEKKLEQKEENKTIHLKTCLELVCQVQKLPTTETNRLLHQVGSKILELRQQQQQLQQHQQL